MILWPFSIFEGEWCFAANWFTIWVVIAKYKSRRIKFKWTEAFSRLKFLKTMKCAVIFDKNYIWSSLFRQKETKAGTENEKDRNWNRQKLNFEWRCRSSKSALLENSFIRNFVFWFIHELSRFINQISCFINEPFFINWSVHLRINYVYSWSNWHLWINWCCFYRALGDR